MSGAFQHQPREASPSPDVPGEHGAPPQARRSGSDHRESSVYSSDPVGAYHRYALSQEETRQRATIEGQQLEAWYSGVLKQEISETVRTTQRLARDNQAILDFAIEEVSRHDSQHLECELAKRHSRAAQVAFEESDARRCIVELHHEEYCGTLRRYAPWSALPRLSSFSSSTTSASGRPPPLEDWVFGVLTSEQIPESAPTAPGGSPKHLRAALTAILKEEARLTLSGKGEAHSAVNEALAVPVARRPSGPLVRVDVATHCELEPKEPTIQGIVSFTAAAFESFAGVVAEEARERSVLQSAEYTGQAQRRAVMADEEKTLQSRRFAELQQQLASLSGLVDAQRNDVRKLTEERQSLRLSLEAVAQKPPPSRSVKKTQTATRFSTNAFAQASATPGPQAETRMAHEITSTAAGGISDWRRTLNERLERAAGSETRQIICVLCDEIEMTATQLEGFAASASMTETMLWECLMSREDILNARMDEWLGLLQAFDRHKSGLLAAQSRYDEQLVAATVTALDHRSASEMNTPNSSFAGGDTLVEGLMMMRRLSRSVTTDPTSLPLNATLPSATSAASTLPNQTSAVREVGAATMIVDLPRKWASGSRQTPVLDAEDDRVNVTQSRQREGQPPTRPGAGIARQRTDSLVAQSSSGMSPTTSFSPNKSQGTGFLSTEDLSGGVSEVASVAPSAVDGPLSRDYSAIDALL